MPGNHIIGATALKFDLSNVIYVDFQAHRRLVPLGGGLNILSCGAGMQSTAVALMSCENAIRGIIHKDIPIYDAVLFCDLGFEPAWVYSQVRFIRDACTRARIPFFVLDTNLYQHYLDNFGERRVVSVPFWTLDENDKKGKMPRNCTLEYKIENMQKFVRWNLLGYPKGAVTKTEDKKRHVMHLGFSYEERRRCSENTHAMFTNRFPLVEMGWTRAESYAYCRDVWGLDTKASACLMCPFHKNYFYRHLKEEHRHDYDGVVDFDYLLERGQKTSLIRNELFISRSRKRIACLGECECDDAELFSYHGDLLWNGF